MKRHLFFFGAILMSCMMFLSSCMSTRTFVRGYQNEPGVEYVYDQGKQWYLFWGLVPIGNPRMETPDDGICEVHTYHGFLDWLITTLTGGIVGSQSIQILTHR